MSLEDLTFLSSNPIDKIVHHDTITIVNDGNTTPSGTNTGAQTAKIVTATAPNPYGEAVMMRTRWSTDGGTTWNDMFYKGSFSFTINGSANFGLRAAVSVGCSASTVYFRTANGYHGNVVSGAYTPISQTFLIEYWLYVL